MNRQGGEKKTKTKTKANKRVANVVVMVMAVLLYVDLFAQPACGPEPTDTAFPRGLPPIRPPRPPVDASGDDGAAGGVDAAIRPDAGNKLDAGIGDATVIVDARPDA